MSKDIPQVNKDKKTNNEKIHKWSMLDGYTYFTYESTQCASCKCDPCDCDWGTNEKSQESPTKR